jgi:hypothetical protein
MSIWESISSALFGSSDTAPSATQSNDQTDQAATSDTSSSSTNTSPTAASGQPVDVAALLASKAEQHPGLNYETSIVDLLKLLNLPSSLADRKELASELNYSGDTEDTATMNQWLHAEVMTKLGEDGGIVPEEWKH